MCRPHRLFAVRAAEVGMPTAVDDVLHLALRAAEGAAVYLRWARERCRPAVMR